MPPLFRKNSAAANTYGKRHRVEGDVDVSGQETPRAEGDVVAAGR